MKKSGKKSVKNRPSPPVTDPIPEHLQPFIADQNYDLYTALDHAAWRYILRVSKAFFKEHAHQKYLDGLKETGILTDRIPKIEEMDKCLRRFGWRAVGVIGFIPPSVFMEFQSLRVLPIACDMRVLEHLSYTPAPDIVHEAAGHAPIIADPEYAAYLRKFGQVARHGIYSDKDMEVYSAIRHLSDVKEDAHSTEGIISEAEKRFQSAIASVDYVSEATYLARLYWWTAEYGLVGDLAQPKIYGAGLLSSVSESYNCLSSNVRKIPLTLDCIHMSYDITRPQPQLFVAPNFKHLSKVLEELASTMAYRKGGLEGLAKAKLAATVTTSTLDTGLQISGKMKDFLVDSIGTPYYIQFEGPCQLSYKDSELPGQGAKEHKHGFGTPLGRFKKTKKGAVTLLVFKSGVRVEGIMESITKKMGKPLVLTFSECQVSHGKNILYKREWGKFDMACGTSIKTVSGGAGDRAKYMAATEPYTAVSVKQKSTLTHGNEKLNSIAQAVRHLRETQADNPQRQKLKELQEKLERDFPDEWLPRLELLELNWENSEILEELQALSQKSENKDLIHRGLELIQR